MPDNLVDPSVAGVSVSADTLIEIDGVGKTYTGQDGEHIVALQDTDLNIGRGEFVSIVGPSGCGKSTLLSLVAGLLETSKGAIRIDGVKVDGPYTDLGFAFQSDLLLDWHTVLRNVLLQCDMRGLDRRAYEARARELIASVGLDGFEDKRPFELSGGMRQRVALCRALLLDPPMLYRDPGHWSKVLAGDALQPIIDDVIKRADVRLIGFGGGGVRHLIVNKPITNMAEAKGLPIRVMGAPIQTRMFSAFGMAPTVIAYAEVYNAIQTGVIDAAENEAAGIQQMKFYEVGPNIALTAHSITVRPLAFSNKTFQRLPADLQAAITQAGKDAGLYGRVTEITEGSSIMAKMEKEGKLKTVFFSERAALIKAAGPVLKDYFTESGAADIYDKIMAVK